MSQRETVKKRNKQKRERIEQRITMDMCVV